MSRQQEYEQRQREKGFTLIKVWVPIPQAEKAKAFCEKLRVEHLRSSKKLEG